MNLNWEEKQVLKRILEKHQLSIAIPVIERRLVAVIINQLGTELIAEKAVQLFPKENTHEL